MNAHLIPGLPWPSSTCFFSRHRSYLAEFIPRNAQGNNPSRPNDRLVSELPTFGRIRNVFVHAQSVFFYSGSDCKPVRLTPALSLIGSLRMGISGTSDSHVHALKGPKGIALIGAGAATHTKQLLENLRCNIETDSVKTLVLPHCHLDHCGAAPELRRRTACPMTAPYISCGILETGGVEAIGVRTAREQGTHPSDFHLEPCSVDPEDTGCEKFEAAGISFRAIHIRGHSKDMF